MNIEWQDSYCIGHERIDKQHKQLFALANTVFLANAQPAYRLAAMQLYSYIRTHFAEEEALMRSINYPFYPNHVQMHTAMISRMNAISEGIGKNEFRNAEINAFMNEWLLQHIAHHDTQIATFIRQRNTPPQQDPHHG